MAEDTSEISQQHTEEVPAVAVKSEQIRGITYERIPFPANGRFVKAFLDAHPEVETSRDLWPDLIEANSGQPEVTMLFPGYKEAHTKSIMKGRTVHNLVEQLGDTIGFVDWMNTLDFCQKVVREANIMLLPSTVYDYDNKHFRFGFGRENMPEALEKFREYLMGK